MNKHQRKQIASIIKTLSVYTLDGDSPPTKEQLNKTQEMIGQVYSEIEEIRAEEETKFDNLSEGLQAGPTGEALQNAISTLDDALGELDFASANWENSDDPRIL